MKKSFVFCAGLCIALVFTGCKSSESAYRKMYEKAQAQGGTQQQEEEPPLLEAPVVAPLTEKPATQTTVVDNVDNVSVRTENVQLVNGAGLQDFSVVVGSFSLKANAEGLQNTLKSTGCDAQIVYNPNNKMYRVISATFTSKAEAAASRNQFRSKYPDAWLLYNK